MVTGSVLIARLIRAAAAVRGADLTDVVVRHGVDPTLADADGRVPHALLVTLWEEGARRLGDERFGLHVAAGVPVGSLGVVEYAVRNAPDLDTAWRRFLRYQRILHDACPFSLEQTGGSVRVVHAPPPSLPIPVAFDDFLCASFLRTTRGLVGEAVVPRAVAMRRPAPSDPSEHRRIFGVDVRFGAPAAELVFDAALLTRPIVNADPTLGDIVSELARARTEDLAATRDFLEETRRAIVARLKDGEPAVEDVARRLAMSERSLHRRLRQEGTSFRELVDDVRRGIALRQLAEPQRTVCEIAFSLGYAESKAFHRAFRRWTGTTPGDWRRGARASSRGAEQPSGA